MTRTLDLFRKQSADTGKKTIRRLDIIADKIGGGAGGASKGGGLGGLLDGGVGTLAKLGGAGLAARQALQAMRGRFGGSGRVAAGAVGAAGGAGAGGPGGLGGAGAPGTPPAVPSSPGVPGGPKAGLKKLLGKVPILGAVLGAATLADAVISEPGDGKSKAEAIGGAAGGLAGGAAGAAGGAALGTMVLPGIGTVIGGIVGGVLGGMSGEDLGRSIGDAASKSPVVEKAGEVLSAAAQAAKDGADGLMTAAKNAAASGAATVADAAAKAPEPLKQIAGYAGDLVPSFAKGAVKKLVGQGRFDAVKGDLAAAADTAGVDPKTLAKIAYFESGYRPDALSGEGSKNAKVKGIDGRVGLSTAYGLGQFTDDTWRDTLNKYGGKYGVEGAGSRGGQAGKLTKEQAEAYRKDPKLQSAMLAEFTRDNVELGRRIGGNNDDANVYALHNLGVGDGQRVLKAVRENPQVSVRDALIGGRAISDKEKARIETVISGNSGLYGDGTISASEAYGRMGASMAKGQVYADQMAPGSAGPASAPSVGGIAALPSPGRPVGAAEQKAPQRHDGVPQVVAASAANTAAPPAVSLSGAVPAVPASVAPSWLVATPVPASAATTTAAMPSPDRAMAPTSIPRPVASAQPEPSAVENAPARRMDSGGGRDRMASAVTPAPQNVSDRHIANVITGGIGAN
ncbi:MAG: hypothetical protein RLZZ373_3170 [Pseudomonadota bacterium]